MIVELDKLSDAPQRIYGEEDLSIQDATDAERTIRYRIELLARRGGETFYFNGTLQGTLSTQCHKCLKPTDLGVDTQFDLIVQRGEAESTEEGDYSHDEYVYIPIGQQDIRLDQYIYENLVINIPMRILCEEDCKGLCPDCGADLNIEACTCNQKTDPRWEALKSLKNKLPKS
jgi:uncharacterized protein